MRNFFGILFLGGIFILMIQTGLVSCTKTNTVTDTVTVIRTDTVIHTDTLQKKDTVLTEAILTANPWKVQEVRALFGNNSEIFYLRGASSGNTANFDNEYITLNSDHTGLYVDNNGGASTLTWIYTTADPANPKVIWIWNLPSPVTVTWEHVYYKNAALHYDEYYNQGGTNILTAEIRIPK
ncbi:MAG: hypothetical protein JST75_17670 [Bacteroidetes bacterium]|nr:hypothetical protein [Bacteroidota bacterium]